MDEVFGELEYDAEYDAKSVTLETTPFQVSENTLVMMDEAVKNMKSGTVSEVIDLSEKEIRNAQYMAKLDRSFDQLYTGKGQEHELIED